MPIPGVTVEDVDAYSDVSNGSTISVDSVASGDNERMPRPPTGGSRRSKSAQSQRPRVAKSPYSSSQFKVSSKEHAPKPSARNMWITAMRNGTASLSTENCPMKTLPGSRATTSKHVKSGSRTQHFRDLVVIDNLKSRNHVRSASLSASEPQLIGAGPAYKPQEDYYDEVIELKKVINALKAENNVISTKLRRVEGENILKDRKLEDLLNKRKQPEDVRRTLTDKKGDTSAIVNSLKQKLHGVERTVKDKETELSQLKKTLKMTNIEELQIQSETYYQEVQRLQLVILEMQQAQVHDHFGKSSSASKEHQGKPSTMTLKRLADENDHLKAENRGLKKDLLSAIENSAGGSKVPLKADYADMSRGQLLAKIHELEEKILKPGEEKRKGSLYEEDKEEGEKSRRSSSASSVAKLTEGRIQLKGSTSQKLAQLQEREVELLEERDKQREVIERLKEDRAHYRIVADDLRMQLQFTQEELDTLRCEKGSVENKRRSSTASSTRKLSVKEVIRPPVDDDEDGMERMLKEFQQKRAAKTLQREWRGYQGRKQRVMQEKEREEENRQNEAAATLQKNWRRHRERAKEMEVKEKEEAITEIQAALRGQAVRSKYIEQLDKELALTDRDDAIVAIQSAMRGHLSRKKHVGEPGYELTSRDFRTRGRSTNAVPGSEPNDDEGLVSRPKNFRQPEAAMTGLRRSSSSESAHDKALVPAPLKRNETRAPKALPRIKPTARDQNSTARDAALVVGGEAHATKSHPSCNGLARSKEESTRDHSRDQSPSALDRALNSSVVARDDTLVGKELAHDPARDLIAHTPGLSESDSDDDNAVVIGRSYRGRTKRKSDVQTDLISSEPVDDTKDNVTVNKESFVATPQTSRGKKKTARKESKKSKINDVSREEEGSRSRLISAPRFSNISEQSEDEEIRMHKSSRSRLDESPHESARRETQQRPKTKTFKVVDSDEDDDDDVVMPSRRTLDTGVSQKRPSLSSSTRGVNLPSRSEDKARPALSRSSQRENGQRTRSKGFEVVDSDDDEDDAVVMPSRRALDTGVSHQRASLSSSTRGVSPPSGSEDKTRPSLSRSGQRENGQRIRSKGFEVVDSDDEEDMAVVMPSRRALDTGDSHQRPSLSLSNRERSPPGGKEDKFRPGLSRTSGKLTASRDVENSEVDSVQSVHQRPGLSSSKRPLSAKKSGKDRFDRAAYDEEENKRVTGLRQSDAPAGSEDDSDGDGVVVMGRKAKTASGGKKTGVRSSLTRKSSATSVSAPPKRETFSDSLDNFFSSSKDANNKKPLRKTSARANEVDDNDDDDDDDDDDIDVSSSSKYKSKQKEAPRKDSRDSVADLWATSEKKGTLKKGKSSSKSPKSTWNPDFEFGKPPRRPESQLDEMF